MLAWLLIGALVAFCGALAVEGYLLLGEARRQTAHARQTLAAANQLLGLVPSKSAPRTDGADEQPRKWWQRLTFSALTVPTDDPCATEPMPAVDLVGGARTSERPVPYVRGRHRAVVTARGEVEG